MLDIILCKGNEYRFLKNLKLGWKSRLVSSCLNSTNFSEILTLNQWNLAVQLILRCKYVYLISYSLARKITCEVNSNIHENVFRNIWFSVTSWHFRFKWIISLGKSYCELSLHPSKLNSLIYKISYYYKRLS